MPDLQNPTPPPSQTPSFRDRWLARLAPSFVVIAVALGWQGYRALQVRTDDWGGAVQCVAAAASVSLAGVGFRIRHRRRDAEH